jgi:hypothetical protein
MLVREKVLFFVCILLFHTGANIAPYSQSTTLTLEGFSGQFLLCTSALEYNASIINTPSNSNILFAQMNFLESWVNQYPPSPNVNIFLSK